MVDVVGLRVGAASQKRWMDAESGKGRSRSKGRMVDLGDVDGDLEESTAR